MDQPHQNEHDTPQGREEIKGAGGKHKVWNPRADNKKANMPEIIVRVV